MNNIVWALAVTLLAAGVLGRPQEGAGEDAVADEVDAPGSGAEVVVADGDDGGDMTEEEDDGDAIKEENKAKCEKCLAPIFRSKHDKFCVKCVSTGIIDTSEQEQIATALKCKKCKTKHKFRARHSDFCDNHCMDATPSTTEEAVVVEEEPEEVEEEPKKRKSNKKKKNKKKFATTFDDDEMDDDYE